jgi:hypothetical protein
VSVHRRRVPMAATALGFLVASILMAMPVGHAQAPPVCHDSLFDRARIVDPRAWLMANARTYIEGRSGEGADVRIVGDVVVLDRATFPTLATRRGGFHTGVGRLVVDARVILLDMEIGLQGGHIVLHAETIRVGPGARLILAGEPGDHVDGLEIVAAHLDLGEASPYGLLGFQTQRWSGTGSAGSVRHVRVSVGRVTPPRGDPVLTAQALAEDPRRFFFNLSNDRGLAANRPWERGYDQVRVGAAGLAQWRATVAAVMQWPLHAAESLLDLHAADPFNDDVRAYITERADSWASLFLTRADARAFLALEHVRELIRWDRDVFGMGRYAVPMVSLDRAIDRFSQNLDQAFGTVDADVGARGLIAWWDEQVVRTLGAESTRAARDAMVAEVERAVRETADERNGLVTAMRASEGRQAQLEQVIEGLQDAVEARRTALAAGEERRQRGREQSQAWFRVANLTVSAAASAFGTPAAGAAVSTVLSAVEAEAMGDAFSPIDAIATFEQMRSIHAQRAEQFRDLRSRWSTVSDGARHGVDLVGEGRWAEARATLGAAHEQMNGILGTVRAHAADLQARPITALDGEALAALDADDALQQENLIRLGAALRDLEGERVGWIARLEEIDRLDRRLLETTATLYELRTLDLTNDAAQRQLRDLAVGVRADLMLGLAGDVARLRRSYEYVSGRPLAVREAILSYADRFSFRESVLRLDAVSGLGVDDSPDAVRARLAREREEAASTYRTFLSDVRRQFEAARADAVLANVVTRTFGALGSARPSPTEEEQAFLEAINEDLYRQVADARHRPTPMPIPYGFDLRDIGPVGLLGITVNGIDLAEGSPLAGEVELVVAHPRHGRIHHGDRCAFVVDAVADDFASDAIEGMAPRRWSYTFRTGQLRTDALGSLTRDFTATTILDYALPLDSRYTLTARVIDPSRHASAGPPALAAIEITFYGRALR